MISISLMFFFYNIFQIHNLIQATAPRIHYARWTEYTIFHNYLVRRLNFKLSCFNDRLLS